MEKLGLLTNDELDMIDDFVLTNNEIISVTDSPAWSQTAKVALNLLPAAAVFI